MHSVNKVLLTALIAASVIAVRAQSQLGVAGKGATKLPEPCLACPGNGPLGRGMEGPEKVDPRQSSFPLTASDKGGLDETGPYTVDPGFFKPKFPAGYTWGRVGGVVAESPDRIYVYNTGIMPVRKDWYGTGASGKISTGYFAPQLIEGRLGQGPGQGANLRREYILTIFNRKGEMVDYWKPVDALHGPGATPHRIYISPHDSAKHVWLLDEGLDHILKYTRDGKLVMHLKVPNHPVDMAFLANGDFYVVEGRGMGNDVIKFNKDGKEISRFGGTGSEPGKLDYAHCIALDRRGRLYIADDGNQRVQVLDPSGKSVDVWPGLRYPIFCAIDKNDHFWLSDANAQKLVKYDLSGRPLYSWGTAGTYPGRFYGIQQFSVDSEGNLYTAEVISNRVQKFVPKKWHRDAAHIIPQLLQ